MTRILVTGGAGGLGNELTPRLSAAGYSVRVMSRRPPPANLPSTLEWAQADLETGSGLKEAVSGVGIIIHAATSPPQPNRRVNTRDVDVNGARQLLELGRAASVWHFIYVSIVGIERIPHLYYREKVAAEAVVREAILPYTILRATQFHSLVDGVFLRPWRQWPLAFIFSDFKFQSIDTGEAAERLVQLAGQPPAGLLPDLGGPQVLTLGEMAKVWFAAQGRQPWIVSLPALGAVAAGFRSGYNTCPDHRHGQLTWAQWVKRKYPGIESSTD